MKNQGLNANQLKLIAIAAMTIDHLTCIFFPHSPTDWWVLLLHGVGRLTAPIMWFLIAEGYHYTKNLKKYGARLFCFAVISHFAYNFAFGIPFVPFQKSVFNQTGVIWPLAWGLVALAVCHKTDWAGWKKALAVIAICAVTFPSDWSCIPVLAVVSIGTNRGDFKRQMAWMMVWVAAYAAVFALVVSPAYGLLQLLVALAIPLLKAYNGQRSAWRGMKWFFYLYYPLHLALCGLLRLQLYGDVGLIIGA